MQQWRRKVLTQADTAAAAAAKVPEGVSRSRRRWEGGAAPRRRDCAALRGCAHSCRVVEKFTVENDIVYLNDNGLDSLLSIVTCSHQRFEHRFFKTTFYVILPKRASSYLRKTGCLQATFLDTLARYTQMYVEMLNCTFFMVETRG